MARASNYILIGLLLVSATMSARVPASPRMPAPAYVSWQHRGGPPGGAPPAPSTRPSSPPPQPQRSNPTYQFRPKGPGPHRGDWLRKYGALPPAEQERQLRQDPDFRSLSPDHQNQLMNRLRKFNNQPPEKKAQILNRMETYEHMSPAQQQQVHSLFDRYHNLPDDRRDKVAQAYRRLRGMPPQARTQLLNSDEFRNTFSGSERDLLHGMTDLNLTPAQPPR